MMITDVTLPGRSGRVDVRCHEGLITEVGPALQRRTEAQVIPAAGGTLLPGLHDHHIHLFALAAAHNSVHCGPPQVTTPVQLSDALRADEGSGWIRGVGYHESVAGKLGLRQLDEMVCDRPLKIQHRSGKLWMVNSLAAELLSLEQHTGLPGNELDRAGNPAGRLFRLDEWMRAQLLGRGQAEMPSLTRVSRLLAGYGVTGLTDASADNSVFAMEQFEHAVVSGQLLQNLRVMGDDLLPAPGHAQLSRGERKVLLDENNLPDWDTLLALFERAHRAGRAVAVHCVTPAELVLSLSVLRAAGVQAGDRIEHASLVPAAVLPLLVESGVRVVTQPGFIYERGDQYRREIDASQHDDLYRCQALLARGIPLAGSSDAPYGSPDPWVAMRAAVSRCSRSGAQLGQAERLTPEQALAMFTSAAADPGGQSRRIAVGQVADLCLLDRSWEEARLRLCSEDVRATIKSGILIYGRDAETFPGRHNASGVA